MTHRVLDAWWHMRASTRKLIIQRPSEGYLLMLLLISDMAFFLSWTLKAVVTPRPVGLELMSLEIGLLFLIAIVARTAAMYVFAMVVGACCRLAGGRGTWRNTRIAVFWGAFVTAPFGMAAAVATVIIDNLALNYPIFGVAYISLPPYWIGLIPFVWYISSGVAKAHGFRRTSPIFFSMSLVALVGLVGGMYFRARGMI